MNRERSFAERREVIVKVEARVANGESLKEACLAEGTTVGTFKGWKSLFKLFEEKDRQDEERIRLQQEAYDRRNTQEDT